MGNNDYEEENLSETVDKVDNNEFEQTFCIGYTDSGHFGSDYLHQIYQHR